MAGRSRWSSRSSGQQLRGWSPKTSGCWAGSGGCSLAGFRWRRLQIPRPWSKCSPRRSSKSWTSGSRHRTCSMWRHRFAELDQRGFVVPRPHPTLVTRRVLVMERLSGFNFDEVDAIRAAGIDTHALVRTGMIGFLEGCMIFGVFHGDLHGGNLFVMDDGRTALLDFGIVGRLDERRRVAFLRLLVGSTMNDVRAQVAAIRDLGALPADTDIDAVIADLGLEAPTIDPTTLDREELISRD